MLSVLKIIVCPYVLFLLVIALSVLLFTDSDYPFGILALLILITPFGILDLMILIAPLAS